MALYLAIKNHVVAMIHHTTYQFLLPDHPPPRFYILLVLISILLIILVKAGLFVDEEISAINGIIFAGNTWEVAEVHRKSDKLEKIDNEDDNDDDDDDDDDDTVDLSNNESRAAVWKDENYGKDQEDIEQLHKRVEDFIRRVQTRFHLEHTTVAGIP